MFKRPTKRSQRIRSHGESFPIPGNFTRDAAVANGTGAQNVGDPSHASYEDRPVQAWVNKFAPPRWYDPRLPTEYSGKLTGLPANETESRTPGAPNYAQTMKGRDFSDLSRLRPPAGMPLSHEPRDPDFFGRTLEDITRDRLHAINADNRRRALRDAVRGMAQEDPDQADIEEDSLPLGAGVRPPGSDRNDRTPLGQANRKRSYGSSIHDLQSLNRNKDRGRAWAVGDAQTSRALASLNDLHKKFWGVK